MIKEMRTKKKRAFTLVELVIVIAVIGILAAILIPTFSSVVDNAKFASDVTDARNMSIKTKEAVILGAKDSAGNPMNVNMNETAGVIAFLKANNFSLIPESKDSAFYYDRAKGEIKILRDEDAFGEGALADDEEKFEQDCVEAILSNRKSFVIIDQNPKNPIVELVETVNNLVTKAYDQDSILDETENSVVADVMLNLFNTANTKVGSNKFVNDSVKSHLTTYSPAHSYYVGNNSTFTTGDTNNLINIVFDTKTTVFSAPIDTSKTLNFTKPINVPSRVESFAENSLVNLGASNTVIINRNDYNNYDLSQINPTVPVTNETGKVSISYENLLFDTTETVYNQYLIIYNKYIYENDNWTTNYLDLTSEDSYTQEQITTIEKNTFVYSGDYTYKFEVPTTAPEADAKEYRLVKSIYAIPSMSLNSAITASGEEVNITAGQVAGFVGENGSNDDVDNDIYKINMYNKDLGAINVIYGSVISETYTFRVLEVAYIKMLSVTTLNTDSGVMLNISDPLAGGSYYNLKDIEIVGVYETNKTETASKAPNGYFSNGYRLDADSCKQIQVKIGETVILTQYLL